MTDDVRPDVGALLRALERHLVELRIRPDEVVVEVGPDKGRKQVSFKLLIGAHEYVTDRVVDTLLDAAAWLNAQPDVRVQVPTASQVVEAERQAGDLGTALARLVAATSGLRTPTSGGDLPLAVAGAQEALERWWSK